MACPGGVLSSSYPQDKSDRYYFETHVNPQVRVVDLTSIDMSASQVLRLSADDKEPMFDDVTSQWSN